jgi:hypothetical protein
MSVRASFMMEDKRERELLAAGAVIHPQLAFDEALQRGVFADELARLHVFLAEAGEEDLGCAGALAVIVDVDRPPHTPTPLHV